MFVNGLNGNTFMPYSVIRENVLSALRYILTTQLGSCAYVKRKRLLEVCYRRLGWSRKDTLIPVLVSSVLNSIVEERTPIVVNGWVWEPRREAKRSCYLYVFERKKRTV